MVRPHVLDKETSRVTAQGLPRPKARSSGVEWQGCVSALPFQSLSARETGPPGGVAPGVPWGCKMLTKD